ISEVTLDRAEHGRRQHAAQVRAQYTIVQILIAQHRGSLQKGHETVSGCVRRNLHGRKKIDKSYFELYLDLRLYLRASQPTAPITVKVSAISARASQRAAESE